MQSNGAPINVYKGRATPRRGVVASEDATGIAVVLAPQVAEEVTPMVSVSGSLIVPRRPQPERVFFAWEDVAEDDTSGPIRILVLRDRKYEPHEPSTAANGHPAPPHVVESS